MKIGEVVQVNSLSEILVQQIGEEQVVFGAFVQIASDPTYSLIGVVADISVSNPNLGAFPKPKRLTPVEIKAVYPDLYDQFPIYLTVVTLGYDEGTIAQRIPPRPPNIYEEVSLMEDEEIETFHRTKDSTLMLEYLNRLEKLPGMFTEDLIRSIVERVAPMFSKDPQEILGLLWEE